jgi:hypothetical protein
MRAYSLCHLLETHLECTTHVKYSFKKLTYSYIFMFFNAIEVMVKVHVVDLKAETVAAPVTVRAYLNQTVTEFKQLISKVSGKIRP